ncbi:unnamed protein product [Mesocestoides corti]|uniref:Serum response factor-binding protein 1 n=1 Tax=Mesocestoides corti TaxID=53468 RepID=A0A0R3ULB4_MESCO|nr:unnamed protein product [Mesocestoides corti]
MPLTYGIDDEHEQLSIDCVELNNVVLAMRPLIKKSKILVLREIASYIKRLKQKQSKAPGGKEKRLGRKIINRLAELRLLKKFSTVKLCKLVLANVNSHGALEKGGEGLTKQERIVVRIANRPEISSFVNRFREEHSDWPTLVHYLLYKNTSGKWKTSEQKRRASKKKKGDLPFPLINTDEILDNQGPSTIHEFAAFKEAHDRELIAAQKRLIAEDEEVDLKESKSLFTPPSLDFKHFDNDDFDEALAKIKVPVLEASPEISGSSQSTTPTNTPNKNKHPNDSSSVKKHDSLPQSAKKPEVEEPTKSSKKPPIKDRKTSPRKVEEATVVRSPQKTPEDDVIHEVIVEDENIADLVGDEEEEVLGKDDVDMKQALRQRKPKPGDRAVFKRAQMNRRQVRPYQRGRDQGYGRQGKAPRPKQNALDLNELHPSWAAKRQQKATFSTKAGAPSGTRIVFADNS